jgi:hypothetical protein
MAHTQGTRSRRRSGEIQARSLTFIALANEERKRVSVASAPMSLK